MRKYYKLVFSVLGKEFWAATGEQVIGALLVLAILCCQFFLGLIQRRDLSANIWSIAWPYLSLVVVLFLYHLVRAPWKLHEVNQGIHKETQEDLNDLRKQIERLNNARPDIRAVFDCSFQSVSLDVENHGAIADVWASLRIKGTVNGNRVDMFARWANQDGERARIAKGETRKLTLAFMKLDSSSRTSTWNIFCAGDASQGVVPAFYSHVIGSSDVEEADIHLYVKVFSDPDCAEFARERHIVLHGSRAEELSD